MFGLHWMASLTAREVGDSLCTSGRPNFVEYFDDLGIIHCASLIWWWLPSGRCVVGLSACSTGFNASYGEANLALPVMSMNRACAKVNTVHEYPHWREAAPHAFHHRDTSEIPVDPFHTRAKHGTSKSSGNVLSKKVL